jgi:hypothetical protein
VTPPDRLVLGRMAARPLQAIETASQSATAGQRGIAAVCPAGEAPKYPPQKPRGNTSRGRALLARCGWGMGAAGVVGFDRASGRLSSRSRINAGLWTPIDLSLMTNRSSTRLAVTALRSSTGGPGWSFTDRRVADLGTVPDSGLRIGDVLPLGGPGSVAVEQAWISACGSAIGLHVGRQRGICAGLDDRLRVCPQMCGSSALM